MPGMLPVRERLVRRAGGADRARPARPRSTAVSVFERKNYFYPDLPCGYQISQYQHPIVGKGKLTIDFPDGTAKDIGITRLHLEMDAGKSLHDAATPIRA